MNDHVTLIITIALIVMLSPFFAKIFKVPTTPVEIIFGAILAWLGLLHDEHLFEIVAEVGFLYLMFIAGTEVNLKKVLKTKAALMKRIMTYLALLYLFSIGFGLYFDLGKIFIVLLPLISVGLVATLSKEYGKTSWLELSMTAGSIGEVVSIAVLTLTSAALKFGVGMELFKAVGALLLFIILIVLVFKGMELLFWWFPEVSTALMPHDDTKEQDIRLSKGVFFILIGVMLFLDLELAFGAFIAGMIIPTFFEHKHELPEKLGSYGFGFLIPVFFVYIGTTFNLEALLMEGLIIKALLIAVGMILMRVISAAVFIKDLGHTKAILMGLSHSMPLTLLIAMATLAYHAKSIDQLHYYAFILAALFQVLIVMILIKVVHRFSDAKTAQPAER